MTVFDRKMDAQNYDINHVILYQIRAAQFTFETDLKSAIFAQNWEAGTQGLTPPPLCVALYRYTRLFETRKYLRPYLTPSKIALLRYSFNA